MNAPARIPSEAQRPPYPAAFAPTVDPRCTPEERERVECAYAAAWAAQELRTPNLSTEFVWAAVRSVLTHWIGPFGLRPPRDPLPAGLVDAPDPFDPEHVIRNRFGD